MKTKKSVKKDLLSGAMTVRELRDELVMYPDDAKLVFSLGHDKVSRAEAIMTIGQTYDMDQDCEVARLPKGKVSKLGIVAADDCDRVENGWDTDVVILSP